MPQDFNFLNKFILFFVISVPFEILLHCPNIDSSLWLIEDVQLIVEKVFREKLMV